MLLKKQRVYAVLLQLYVMIAEDGELLEALDEHLTAAVAAENMNLVPLNL